MGRRLVAAIGVYAALVSSVPPPEVAADPPESRGNVARPHVRLEQRPNVRTEFGRIPPPDAVVQYPVSRGIQTRHASRLLARPGFSGGAIPPPNAAGTPLPEEVRKHVLGGRLRAPARAAASAYDILLASRPVRVGPQGRGNIAFPPWRTQPRAAVSAFQSEGRVPPPDASGLPIELHREVIGHPRPASRAAKTAYAGAFLTLGRIPPPDGAPAVTSTVGRGFQSRPQPRKQEHPSLRIIARGPAPNAVVADPLPLELQKTLFVGRLRAPSRAANPAYSILLTARPFRIGPQGRGNIAFPPWRVQPRATVSAFQSDGRIPPADALPPEALPARSGDQSQPLARIKTRTGLEARATFPPTDDTPLPARSGIASQRLPLRRNSAALVTEGRIPPPNEETLGHRNGIQGRRQYIARNGEPFITAGRIPPPETPAGSPSIALPARAPLRPARVVYGREPLLAVPAAEVLPVGQQPFVPVIQPRRATRDAYEIRRQAQPQAPLLVTGYKFRAPSRPVAQAPVTPRYFGVSPLRAQPFIVPERTEEDEP